MSDGKRVGDLAINQILENIRRTEAQKGVEKIMNWKKKLLVTSYDMFSSGKRQLNRSISIMKSMFASAMILLALAPSTFLDVDAFSPHGRTLQPIRSLSGVSHEHKLPPHQTQRDYENKSASSRSSPSSRYQDDVEFFDLDDDDDDDDDDLFGDEDYARDKRGRDNSEDITFNGIIPNPLLDAMDPDGVYERLGPELFKDWTFFRDMALFAIFLTLFTGDTHLYGTFDSVIERLEDLPADFIK